MKPPCPEVLVPGCLNLEFSMTGNLNLKFSMTGSLSRREFSVSAGLAGQ